MFKFYILAVILCMTASADLILRDLQPTPSVFVQYTSNWDSSTGKLSTTKCGSETMLGGFQKFGEGFFVEFVYTDLPEHTAIEFRVKVWHFGFWDDDLMQFEVSSGTEKTTLTSAKIKTVDSATNFCASSAAKSGYSTIYGSAPHTGSFLSIRVYSSLKFLVFDSSWGINQFSVVAKSTASSSGTICNTASSSSLTVTGTQCECSDGQYRNSNGACVACNPACLTCYGSEATQCFTCDPSQPGYEQCMCPAPLKYSQGKCIKACDTGKIDYQGQCIDSCPGGTSESNGQCVSSCTAAQVLDEGQCKAYCPYPKVRYNNGCVDSCPSHTVQYQYVCSINCPYYKKNDKKCVSLCPPPKLSAFGRCVDFCPFDQFEYKGECVSHCPLDKVQLGKYCIDSCPTGMTKKPFYYGNSYYYSYCENNAGGTDLPYGTCPPPMATYQGECLLNCPAGTRLQSYTCVPDVIFRDVNAGLLDPIITYPEYWISPQFPSELPKQGCTSDYNVLGGLGNFGKGVFLDFVRLNLPEHTRIDFRVKVWYIGEWNDNSLKFEVSSRLQYLNAKYTLSPGKVTVKTGPPYHCGVASGSNGGYAVLYGSAYHIDSVLRIRAVSDLLTDSSTASWAIREFSVIARNAPGIPYSSICHIPSSTLTTTGICEWTDGFYRTNSGTNIACHQACLSCYGPEATQCFTCNPSYSGYADCMCPAPFELSEGKCVCAGGTLLHMGKCVDSCPSPYVAKDGKCVSPCPSGKVLVDSYSFSNWKCQDSCPSGQLEYRSGECEYNCDLGMWQSEGKCVFACPSSKFKDYNNYSCVSSCPPPMLASVDECVSTCPSGEFSDNGICTPCLPPKFLHQGQCLDTCPTGTMPYKINTPYICITISGSTCSPPKVSHQGQCLDTCPTGTTKDTTSTPYTCKTCSPPKFFHQSQCLDTCPTGTTPDTTTTPYTCKTNSGNTCSPPKFSYQGQCLNNCPTGTIADTTTYTCTAASSDCIPNCAVCDGQKCKICKTGFKKFDDTTCYPVCPAGKKLTSAGVCEEPTYKYQTPSCIDKLKQGLDDQTCKLSNGLQAVYEVTYNPSTHYFSQKQDGVTMTCSDNQQTRKLSASGSYLATLIMIAKRASVSTLNGLSLTSAQDIGTSISPLVTDRCDFAPVLPTKLTGFPFYLLGVFPLMTQGADFSTIAAAQLSQIYSKTFVDRAIGNLVACGQSCSAILVWKHTNANKPISSHATMLVKLTTTTAAGTMDQIFKNAQVAFADPAANNSAKREKSTLCYDEGGLRYCASELIIYKKKSA